MKHEWLNILPEPNLINGETSPKKDKNFPHKNVHVDVILIYQK